MGRGPSRKAPPGQKWCPTCKDFRDASSFNLDRGSKDGLQAYCKDCRAKQQRSDYAKDPRKYIDRQYLYNYGIEAAAYRKLLEEQNGVCAACGNPELPRRKTVSATRLSVDHDHTTGKVRGLLCSNCNTALGLLQESPERILALLTYLRTHTPAEEERASD